MAAKAPRLRWRKDKADGWNPPEVHLFTDGTTVHARVQEIKRTGWFWYGMGENTANRPVATLEEAKAQAEAHVRPLLSKTSG